MSAGECVMLLCRVALSVVELQEGVSFLKIASNQHVLSPGDFISVLCCSTEVSAVPRSFVDCWQSFPRGISWPFVIHGAAFALRMLLKRKY